MKVVVMVRQNECRMGVSGFEGGRETDRLVGSKGEETVPRALRHAPSFFH
jgi:hypothetical protein